MFDAIIGEDELSMRADSEAQLMDFSASPVDASS